MKPAIPLRNAVLVSGCLLGFRCAQGDDWKPVIRRNGVTDPYDAGWQLSSNCIPETDRLLPSTDHQMTFQTLRRILYFVRRSCMKPSV